MDVTKGRTGFCNSLQARPATQWLTGASLGVSRRDVDELFETNFIRILEFSENLAQNYLDNIHFIALILILGWEAG